MAKSGEGDSCSMCANIRCAKYSQWQPKTKESGEITKTFAEIKDEWIGHEYDMHREHQDKVLVLIQHFGEIERMVRADERKRINTDVEKVVREMMKERDVLREKLRQQICIKEWIWDTKTMEEVLKRLSSEVQK